MEIKFSHDYEKLPLGWEGKEAVLIGLSRPILLYKLLEYSPEFIKYDTKIREEDKHYDLKGEKTEYIILTLLMATGEIFTTIRRYTPEKWNYYNRGLNNTFILVRTNKEGKKE